MRNQNIWEPSKFVKSKSGFKITNDTSKVGIGNRIIGDIQAKNYSELIKKHAFGILFDIGCGDVALYQMYKSYVTKIFCADWPNTLRS